MSNAYKYLRQCAGIAFRTWMSSTYSATICFYRQFSSSNLHSTFTSLASSNTYLSFRRCIVNLEMSGGAPQSFPMSPPCACTHSRLISDCVSEEEHQTGKVRCVECGDIVPDPHLQREAKAT